MVRYLGPKLRVVRRLRTQCLPGFSKKFNSTTRYNSGNLQKNISAYGERLEEKQKVRFNYGLTDTQLKKYLELAQRIPGPSGINLLILLEMRLDATLFRVGFSSSIQQGRQLITHGHIFVNYSLIQSPSFKVNPGDIIHINPINGNIIKLIKRNLIERQAILEQYPITAKEDSAHKICYSSLKAIILRSIYPREALFKFNDLLILGYYR
nr:ribosomal protein S4 [Coccidia sp. AB-2023a]WPW47595.1 ribosomal protein S4 [Coccidia sp. AB-2023a]